ncbi:hypothetical protein [Ancylobacter oerskovii]|uniref:hypothetical protein n=1 Tax=Ancylobacter oerskovii TaxID=459519 RepID=UPI001BCE5905|nr:hypothetical protein [Ancylobacter oerskovii]
MAPPAAARYAASQQWIQAGADELSPMSFLGMTPFATVSAMCVLGAAGILIVAFDASRDKE